MLKLAEEVEDAKKKSPGVEMGLVGVDGQVEEKDVEVLGIFKDLEEEVPVPVVGAVVILFLRFLGDSQAHVGDSWWNSWVTREGQGDLGDLGTLAEVVEVVVVVVVLLVLLFCGGKRY